MKRQPQMYDMAYDLFSSKEINGPHPRKRKKDIKSPDIKIDACRSESNNDNKRGNPVTDNISDYPSNHQGLAA